MTLVNLNKKDMPEELSHEEVIALKDLDLDATLLDIASDDWVDDMASPKQPQSKRKLAHCSYIRSWMRRCVKCFSIC